MKLEINVLIVISLIILFALIAWGCSTADLLTIAPDTTKVKLTPFQRTKTSKVTINLTDFLTITPDSTQISSPTPTPFTYTVVEGDTFTTIAFHHGVKLSDLIAANPDIDPNFLIVGISITIPIKNNNSTIQLNPTPIPLKTKFPVCYRNQIDGLWCFAQIINTQPYDVENISAEFILSSKSSNEEISQVVFSPLYVLDSESQIPLMAYFEPPTPADIQIEIKILSVIPKSNEAGRYLTPRIENESIQISENYLKADVEGEIYILENLEARQIWILGVAYSQDGRPVGFRKWAASSPLPAGEKESFRFIVYSLGPLIDNIELQIEAHP